MNPSIRVLKWGATAAILLCSFSWASLVAQSATLDSLHQVLAAAKHDSSRVACWQEIARYHLYHEIDSAQQYIDTALYTLRHRPGLKALESRVNFHKYSLMKAFVHHGKWQIDTAAHYYRQAMELTRRVGNEDGHIEVSMNYLALLLQAKSSQLDAALSEFLSWVDTLDSPTAREGQYMGRYYQARSLGERRVYGKAAEICIDLLNFPDSAAQAKYRDGTLNTLSLLLLKTKNESLARKYFRLALGAKSLPGFLRAQVFNNLASTFFSERQFDSLSHYVNLALAEPYAHEDNKCQSYHLLARAAHWQKDYEEAAKWLRLSKKHGANIENINIYIESLLIEKDLLFNTGKYSEAQAVLNQLAALLQSKPEQFTLEQKLLYHKQWLEQYGYDRGGQGVIEALGQLFLLQDSILKSSTDEAINELTIQYEAERTEQENRLLRQERSLQQIQLVKQRYYLASSILAVLLAGLLALIYYRSYRKKERNNQQLALRNEQIELYARDLQHRTRGQFNIVTALLHVQQTTAKDLTAKEVLHQSENQLRALATINKRLSFDRERSTLLKDSISEIAQNQQFNGELILGKNISLDLQLPEIQLDEDKVLWLGLIVNELMTNSIKYAFRQELKPGISIKLALKPQGYAEFYYQDNGKFQQKKSNSGEGMGLIHKMVEQLNGQAQINTNNSFSFLLRFLIG
jgi:two-component sensor histidine kinase